ncbi:hypothetical protein CJD36_014870 [Flavipsychrobacter stenotrophus]|uniref:SnoaL-like domain-containing protein n=1 Tax=Flavipsychrobacter stenotrophus TaxID=2077091 RepID=A0A2S7SSS3_9BACT|nr:hypothetical protein CJD36_014870 [Flavipsychrobacter stenotrophus]
MASENLNIVLAFLKTLENRTSSAELDQFYHPDILQTEYPNTLTKNTANRTFDVLKDAADKGKIVLQKETYEVVNSYEHSNTVIIEAIFRGTLAIPVGNIPVGGEMKAYFAQFYEFKDGKIIKWRNYDCFEPFS